ncbi:hypothetical protein POP72_019 [Pectobacterium phage POP72]|uniref:Uncharacterized protein n=2 Tax=Axomammavirus PP1 TaxID=2733578 RepID=I7FNT0_9CAUD|nr:hypothetical protein F486_gp17 [Pectobacterium phage PP1]AFP33680.1 hypothetical protein PP1_017 [Pectobacterium phage PP1]ARB10935.1 hypothetical protein POP72_019 [Pectobacterium phage POP72]
MIKSHKYLKTKDNMIGIETKLWNDGRFSVTIECRRVNGMMYRQSWQPSVAISAEATDELKLEMVTNMVHYVRKVYSGKEL